MVYRQKREQRRRAPAPRHVLLLIAALLLAISMLPLLHPTPAQAAAGGVLYSPNLSTYPNADASYPRVIRLEANGSANGTLLATFSRSGHGGPSDFPIYRSLDGGTTWSASPISVVSDTVHGWSIDAPTLFELPQAVGTLPAGAILAAGTAWIHGPIVNGSVTGADYRQQDMQVYVSLNQGQSWSYHSSCASSSNMPNQPGYGIWEPSFALDSQGRLVCYSSSDNVSARRLGERSGPSPQGTTQ